MLHAFAVTISCCRLSGYLAMACLAVVMAVSPIDRCLPVCLSVCQVVRLAHSFAVSCSRVGKKYRVQELIAYFSLPSLSLSPSPSPISLLSIPYTTISNDSNNQQCTFRASYFLLPPLFLPSPSLGPPKTRVIICESFCTIQHVS